MDFNFAQGTDFEQKVMQWMWELKRAKGEDPKDLCKPDIYDIKTNTMFEAKMTRPYYDKTPSKYDDAQDLGTGLPVNQFNRYCAMRQHGIRVILIHKMSEGKFENKIFISELTDDLIKKVNHSFHGKTVYWNYDDLNLMADLEL
jgi:hypothetical protein